MFFLLRWNKTIAIYENRFGSVFFAGPRPGNVNAGVLNNAGNNENYWSSTVSSATIARNLGFNSTVVNPENENNRYNGFSLRCVAR
ncbi:hypothetical protein IKF03_02910 [Candidatus Saccharibacteria bacterium]|nr:hypothetical protein [Candidatus Saccharibacteria bacterium]